ncbi:BMP family ABC transporter substrate-binding protein [Amaricoccus sp.]|uniref:BMP family ABC transporter substrate-binding protein n=1 Tax=Amaricoccus sp. TaxID=1872485 RepID=UPI0026279FFE|nr:BMP family ABC transporter substrate-binding protein [Amaricoccus sp.]HRO12464.1 BMP family ABC transporter substrate-binding protein [Amaricoccus sp.]
MTLMTRRSLLRTGAAAAALPLVAGRAFAQEPLKVGFVYVGPVGDFGYTYAHDQGRQEADAHFGDRIRTTYVENVAEGPDSERVIRNLAEDGNQLIFTCSFGFMNPTIKVAKRFPDVKFEHCSGYQRAENVATYNARFYEGRAVCGTIAAKMSKSGVAGYIASFPIPEVVSGINAFTLAARRVNPAFQTKVVWVSSWYDPAKEADAAKALFDQGADVIAQHTDSPAALQAAEQRGLWAFGQAWDMSSFAPKAHLTAIQNHWGAYYIERIQKTLDGAWESGDAWWGFKEGMLKMSPFNPAIPADVIEAANETEVGIVDGSAPPFAGPIVNQAGEEKAAAGSALDDPAILSMDWYVEGVQS